MTDLAEVAASVAKALELVPSVDPSYLWEKDPSSRWNAVGFFANGSNLTDPYWIWRCVEWLTDNGMWVEFAPRASRLVYDHSIENHFDKTDSVSINCPAAEFPARAIHKLMQRQK